MKNTSFFVCKVLLAVVLSALVFLPCGCGRQLGETKAEASRRHKRVLSINHREMMEDIDKVFLMDKPSKLTDKRIP
jgi:hypothetical protein